MHDYWRASRVMYAVPEITRGGLIGNAAGRYNGYVGVLIETNGNTDSRR